MAWSRSGPGGTAGIAGTADAPRPAGGGRAGPPIAKPRSDRPDCGRSLSRSRAVPLNPRLQDFHTDLTAWRRDIHAHPELGFEEQRTSDLVAAKLAEFGIEVHRNIGKTGVVGVLRVGNSHRSIGLRADMDALPILEANTFDHHSRHKGTMHACGHDGHTTMLLGAARYLAETRQFDGTVNFIFQPAEEGL